MTPKETDKKIEFILQMQARFESNQEKLGANLDKLDAKLEKQAENLDKLRLFIAETAQILRDSIQLSDERFTRLDARLDARFAELTLVHKEGEERLNSLINVVERHLTGPDHARPAQ